MTEYDLYSTDWAKITLLHSEHLVGETLYHEQTHRWGLQYGRGWGVVQMGPEDLVVSGSDTGYEVSVGGCRAITKRGYVVHIGADDAPITLQGSNDRHRDSQVPIYIGVCMEKESGNAGSSQTGALLDRPMLRWSYSLSTEANDPYYDWLQVGRMRKEGPPYVRDDKYIPQCVHLRSHPSLYGIVGEIRRTAATAMLALDQAARIRSGGQDVSPSWVSLVGVMISALSPASVLIDWDAAPRQYLERLTMVLGTYLSLLPLIQSAAPNSNWKNANDLVLKALTQLGVADKGRRIDSSVAIQLSDDGEYGPEGDSAGRKSHGFFIEQSFPGTFWWDTFDLVRQAIQALSILCQGLTPGPGQEAPSSGSTQVIKPQTPFVPVRPVGR